MTKSIKFPAELDLVKEGLQTALAQGEIPASFNLDQWLQDWLQRPQPALGGTRPVDLLSTNDGIEAVRRALGAVISGAYQ